MVSDGLANGDWLAVAPGECVINGVLAEALGMTAPGETAALNVPAPGDVPRDATLAQRRADDVASRPQLRVARIAAEPGMASMFNLEGGQRLPRNAWMNLADLQREVRQPRRVRGRIGIQFLLEPLREIFVHCQGPRAVAQPVEHLHRPAQEPFVGAIEAR